MGRGLSSGGGQSSLGYLFGNGEVPKSSPDNAKDFATESRASHKEPAPKPNAAAQPVDVSKQIPAGIQSSTMNNHSRSVGDNICRIGHQQRSRLLLVEVLLWDIYLVAAANKIKSLEILRKCLFLFCAVKRGCVLCRMYMG